MLAFPLQGFFESIFSAGPFSKLFELNGSVHEWWFRWKLDRFVSIPPPPPPRPPAAPADVNGRSVAWQAVIHGMLFAFIYLVLQKRQVLSESKGEALFSARISSLLLFLSVVSFIVRPSSCLTAGSCRGDAAGHGVVPRGFR